MRKIRLSLAPSALAVSLMFCTPGFAQTEPASQIAPILPAAVTLNLMTSDGMAVLDAQWKNMDARIVEVPAMEREVDTWPMAYDIDPHAGGSDYDDSDWPVIPAEALANRRGGGRIFFTSKSELYHQSRTPATGARLYPPSRRTRRCQRRGDLIKITEFIVGGSVGRSHSGRLRQRQ